MRYLVTNDDGIYAEGLVKLVEALKKRGDVVICAPLKEQSAKSHSIETKNSFKVEKLDNYLGCEAYAIDSTPADCVRFAVYALKLDFDVICSGVNNGLNLGDDILYSGTCGAAVEGALRGYKGIAFSASHGGIGEITDEIDRALDIVEKEKLLDKWMTWNINIPKDFKEYAYAVQGDVNFYTYFEENDGYWRQLGHSQHELETRKNTDVYNLHRGKMTITPLAFDRTKYF